MTRQAWTTSEVATLRRLAGAETAHSIAAALGRTLPSVYHAAQRLGIPLRKRGAVHHRAKWPDECVAELRQLHAAGVGPRGLSERFGMPLGTVQSILYRGMRK